MPDFSGSLLRVYMLISPRGTELTIFIPTGEASRDASEERELERDCRRLKRKLDMREYGEEDEVDLINSRRAWQRTSLCFSM